MRRPFIQCVEDTFSNLGDTHPPDFILGVASIVILVALKMLNTHYGTGNTWKHKAIWLMSTGRSAVVVILAGLFAYGVIATGQLDACDKKNFKRECLTIILDLPSGMPDISPPSLEKSLFSVRSAVMCVLWKTKKVPRERGLRASWSLKRLLHHPPTHRNS